MLLSDFQMSKTASTEHIEQEEQSTKINFIQNQANTIDTDFIQNPAARTRLMLGKLLRDVV